MKMLNNFDVFKRIIYVMFELQVYIFSRCVCSSHRGQEMVSGPLEELVPGSRDQPDCAESQT